MDWVRFNRRGLLASLCAVLAPLETLAGAPTSRQILAFYYGWYGGDGHRTFDDAPEMPAGGPYDSLDPDVVVRHVAQAKSAGLTGLIASWWGKDDRTDRQLPALLDAAAAGGLSVSAYVETGDTPEAVSAAILYLYRAHGGHAAWLKLGGRPVVFLYDRVLQALGDDGWRRARAAIEAGAPGAMAFVGTGNGHNQIRRRAPYFDALHIYDMAFYLAQTHAFGWLWRLEFYRRWVKSQTSLRLTTATVMPGFDDRKVAGRPAPRPVVDRRDGRTLRDLFAAAIAARPDWILIVSFNEWHEGSEIEPSARYGDRDLKTCAAMSAKFLR